MKTIFVSILASLTLIGFANSTKAGIIVQAGYTSGDTTVLQIINSDGSALTGVSMTGVGLTLGSVGLSGTVGLPDVGAASSSTYTFFISGGVFSVDYDDFHTGEAKYTITGTENGVPLSTTFSPSSNQSGGFVAFLGNDSSGAESDAVVSFTTVGTMTPVPEPSTYLAGALLLLPVGLQGYRAIRNRKLTA